MTATINEKSALLIPPSLQRQAGFKLGDRVEYKVSRGRIVIVQEAEPASPLVAAFRATQEEARRKGTDKLTMKQINNEIAAYRKEKRQKAAKQRAK